MKFDTRRLTIKQIHKDLIKKKYSVRDLITACLNCYEKYNKKINAILNLNERIIEEAEKCDKDFFKNNEIILEKPLFGIPFAIKDNYSTKGLPTTAGSKVLKDYIPPYDATVIRYLKKAGALIIGKSNMDAWGHGSSGENSDFGPTRNPFDCSKTPGGSSSGSAAALASGMCIASTGTDTGGSIRLPACFCNVVGLKPTYGRVSRFGIIAMGSSLDSIGHFTNSVYDSALILSITARIDPYDSTTFSLKNEIPFHFFLEGRQKTNSKDLFLESVIYNIYAKKNKKNFTLGVIKEFITDKGINLSVKKAFEKSCKLLEDNGFKLQEISIPHIKYSLSAYYIIVMAEISSNLGRMDGIRFGFNRSYFGAEAIRRILIGTYVLSAGYYDAYYKKALKIRTLIKNEFNKALESVDAIISPVSPSPPFKIGERSNDPVAMYLSDIFLTPVNLAGLPSLSVPTFPAEKMPSSIQIIAKQGYEALLFIIGSKFEAIRGKIGIPLKI